MPFVARRLTMDRELVAARWWYALVALPMFQFLVYRALWRWAIWIADALAAVAPAAAARGHAPRPGGRARFLSWPSIGFAYVIAALSATQAGVWADQVLHAGLKVTELKWQALVFVLAGVVVALGPLLVVLRTPLAVPDRRASIEYGSLAIDYTRLFQARWIARRERNDVLGSADIQSLADLANGYDVVDRCVSCRSVRARSCDRRRGAGADDSRRAARGAADQLLKKLAGTLLGKPG